MIIVTGCIEKYDDSKYLAWAEGDAFKGIVVQGTSVDEVKKELWTSLKVHVAYNLGLDISKINGKELKEGETIRIIQETEDEFQMQLV